MNPRNNFLQLIEKKRVVSLIGMAKNVGKTTTLNYIIEKLMNKKTIGLTSIGRDGEVKDVTFDTPKPRIYISKGTIIATTSTCLKLSDFTKKVLKTTSIYTPLGEVVIVKALSDGYVELAGPSINSQIKTVIKQLQKYGAELVLIDGAINRKSIASIDISDATILCSGASYSSNIEKVVNDTLHIVNMFKISEIDKSVRNYFKEIINKTKVALIDKNHSTKYINIPSIVNNEQIILDELNKDVRYLFINGAITNSFINKLYAKNKVLNNLIIVIKHAANCLFISENSKFNRIKDNFRVLKKIDLLGISINPTSPYGYQFDEREFFNKLRTNLNLPIINVMSDNYEIIY